MDNLNNKLVNFEEQNKKTISGSLRAKVISTYNEFVRKYHLKDSDVNISVVSKELEVNPQAALDMFSQKLHSLKMQSYQNNIEKGVVSQTKENLLKILMLEKEISVLKEGHADLDFSLVNHLDVEEKNYEKFINENINKEDNKEEKFNQLEGKMLDLNNDFKNGYITKEEYNKEYDILEQEKVDLVWGLSILDPDLLKEKHIDIADPDLVAGKDLERIDIDEQNKIEGENYVEMEQERYEQERASQTTVEEISYVETTVETTTTTTMDVSVSVEDNDFIVYLQSKVLVNQDKNNIVNIVKAQEQRDLERSNQRQIDILER